MCVSKLLFAHVGRSRALLDIPTDEFGNIESVAAQVHHNYYNIPCELSYIKIAETPANYLIFKLQYFCNGLHAPK